MSGGMVRLCAMSSGPCKVKRAARAGVVAGWSNRAQMGIVLPPSVAPRGRGLGTTSPLEDTHTHTRSRHSPLVATACGSNRWNSRALAFHVHQTLSTEGATCVSLGHKQQETHTGWKVGTCVGTLAASARKEGPREE